MRIFITGASGFIGTAVTKELIEAGHKVLGMARSDEGAAIVKKAGADVHRGTLEDLDSLKRGASECDGVIHCAFNHDFSDFAASCEADKRAIETLGSVLVGSKRPLIVTSGTGFEKGRLRTEEDPLMPSSAHLPRASEEAAASAEAQGVHTMVVRLPQVHDRFKQGLITWSIDIARKKGVSAYVGEGRNRWPACPRHDAARLYRLVLEKGVSGARYHAVAEEGVSAREIAEAIGRGLKVPVVSISPEEASEQYGFLGIFMGLDMSTSSALTQQRLGWRPIGPKLIDDLNHAAAFEENAKLAKI